MFILFRFLLPWNTRTCYTVTNVMVENNEMDDHKIDWRTIGNRIADMRISRGLTQFQLAELTGLSRVYIGYIEQGKRSGTILTYLDIVSVLGYSLNDLVGGTFLESDAELLSELSIALLNCRGPEKASVIRILQEMLMLLRNNHGGDMDIF